ncbi:hypothetical protein SISNIDRAFT_398885, partial [Sistotremastrum niveocremeum HHB9708]
EDFHSRFWEDVKLCAEKFQRHVCGDVCWKNRPTRECRFNFPHDIVSESRFDPDTNSVWLKCSDPTINWFNPYISAYCRHNHDIKSILSGRSAKAAMFYISDYITKAEMSLGDMLSLL